MDDRAVSRVLGYAMVLSISTVLVAGLLIAGGTFVDDQRDHVVDSELEVVGQRLAADVATADRLVRMGSGETTVRVATSVPDSIAGSDYNVEVLPDGGNSSLLIEVPRWNRTVTVPVSNTTALAPIRSSGGDLVVEYDRAAGHLEVGNE